MNLEGVKDPYADMMLELYGGTDNTLFDIGMSYRDDMTKSMNLGLKTQSYLSAAFGYNSFVHNLDHDQMENLEGKAGGKQVYHTDNDPMGRYYMQYEKFAGNVKIDLPFVEGGAVYAGLSEQHKSGYKQTMTIDHCAFCHVESRAQRVDQMTRTWTAGLQGTAGMVSVNYDFSKTDFRDRAGQMSREWLTPMHPVYGQFDPVSGADYIVEFTSRTAFAYDVSLPYAKAADNDKTSHNAGLKLDLADKGSLKGAYTNTNRQNYYTGVENEFEAYSFGYAGKLSRNMRLTARYQAYETKVDDVFVDLPNFRYDRPAGDLNFDWTRISSANREVQQADLGLAWRMGKGRSLKLGLRSQVIDRPAMAQSQTNYIFDGVNTGEAAIVETMESEAYANETKVFRAKLRYDARLGLKGNYNLTYTMTNVDKPFMNPTAMCEESLEGVSSPHGTALERLYYFQRERWGNGTNQASQAHKATARFSYQLSPRTSLSGYVTYAKDKNDEMNLYEFDRDMLSPGINLWTAPDDKLLFTLGWANQKIESNANLCVPIFDG
jgi:hypothetical protein